MNNITTKNDRVYNSRNLGFIVLVFLVLTVPFNFAVIKIFPYYRDVSALLFIALAMIDFKANYMIFTVRKEIFYILLSLLFIFLLSFFDNGKSLYGSVNMSNLSENIGNINPTFYVLRNVFLYVPMLLYFYQRGLTKRQINIICAVISLTAPVSIILFLKESISLNLSELGMIFSLGGRDLSYNTYVPFLTFPFLTCIYLILSVNNKYLKSIYLINAIFIFLYVLATSSRQSTMFNIIIILWFFGFSSFKNKSYYLFFGIIGLVYLSTSIYEYVSVNYEISDKLLDRFSSAEGFSESSRFDKWKYGLGLLSLPDFILGSGLTSVVFSGPHNDYVRWIQRIGVFGMILSFLPYIVALKNNLFLLTRKKKSLELFLTSSGLMFTLYHSFFGYPRDDAYQSLYSFLGLMFWLVVVRNNMEKELLQTP